MYPRIGEIEKFFMNEGALTAKMSGSGPTVFAVFEDEENAVRAAEAFKETCGKADGIGDGCEVISCRFVYDIH